METSVTVGGAPDFESLKELGDDGQDWWSARILQQALGYAKWQEFEAAISRLTLNSKTSNFDGNAVFDRFDDPIQMPRGGVKYRVNYWLNRYAAYRLVMELDSKTPGVNAAKHYFTGRVRQAELADRDQLTTAIAAPISIAAAYRRLAEILEREEAYQAQIAAKDEHIEAITPHANLGAQVEAHEEHMALSDFASRHRCNQLWFFNRIDAEGVFGGCDPIMYNAGSSRNKRRAPYATYRDRGFFKNVAPAGYVDSWHLTAKGRTWLLDILTKEGLIALAGRPIDKQCKDLPRFYKGLAAPRKTLPENPEDQL